MKPEQAYVQFKTDMEYDDAATILNFKGVPYHDDENGAFIIPQWGLEIIHLETNLLENQDSVIVLSAEDEKGLRSASRIFKDGKEDEQLGYAIFAEEEMYIPANLTNEPKP